MAQKLLPYSILRTLNNPSNFEDMTKEERVDRLKSQREERRRYERSPYSRSSELQKKERQAIDASPEEAISVTHKKWEDEKEEI